MMCRVLFVLVVTSTVCSVSLAHQPIKVPGEHFISLGAIKMIPVSSRQMIAIGYDPDSRTMAIVFDVGNEYRYANIEKETFQAMLSAKSVGSYFHRNIKTKPGTYPYSQVERQQVRQLLSSTLKGIISQQLLPRADETGRVAAVEVLVNTERVAEKLKDEELTASIVEDITEGEFFGMRSYDQAILTLYARGDVSFEDALSHATSTTDFKVAAQARGVLSA